MNPSTHAINYWHDLTSYAELTHPDVPGPDGLYVDPTWFTEFHRNVGRDIELSLTFTLL